MYRWILAQVIALMCLYGCSVGRELPVAPPSAADARPVSAEEYRLGAGDVVSLRVYDWRMNTTASSAEEDLRLEKIRLDTAGNLTLPFGQFKASGRTVKEVETDIIASLKGRLLRNPRVLFTIDEYRPFFVEGQVTRPGAYPYQPGLNVRKAVTIGGGFRERASFEKIFLVREGDTFNRRIRVNLNSPVGPGDTVTVEESFF
jgi:protein involved in polysaccharide export with SLBB domain